MSSSDDDLGWHSFAERPQAIDAELWGPASEVTAVLRRYRNDMDTERRAAKRAYSAGLTVAVELANHIFRFSAALEAGQDDLPRQLDIVRRQMLEVLRQGQITIADPLGRTYDEVVSSVDVVGWRHGPEYATEAVAETIEPVIFHRSELIRRGQVIMVGPEVPDDGTSPRDGRFRQYAANGEDA